jgi:hypothetical protein
LKCFYFFNIGFHEVFAWGWLWTVIHLISASGVARVTDVSHQHLTKVNITLGDCTSQQVLQFSLILINSGAWSEPISIFGYLESFVIGISNTADFIFPSFKIIIYLFTGAYIVWVISPSSPCPYPLTPTPLLSRQNLFYTFLQFHWRIEISNNKNDVAFLLVKIKTAIQRDS